MEEFELDPSAVEDAAQLVGEFGQREKQNEATAEAKQLEYDTEQKALTEQADPREADQWGLKAVAKEAQQFYDIVGVVPPMNELGNLLPGVAKALVDASI